MRHTLPILLICLAVLLCGCQEEQQVWGTGEPTPDWEGYFGNGNLSRLNFVQMRQMDLFRKAIIEQDGRIAVLEERIYPSEEVGDE